MKTCANRNSFKIYITVEMSISVDEKSFTKHKKYSTIMAYKLHVYFYSNFLNL